MKKIFSGAGIIAVGSVLALSLIASADNVSLNINANANSNEMAKSSQAMTLQVGSSGRVMLRGTIDSVGANSLMVKSWGGSWTVNVIGATQILPANGNHSITSFKAGDFVGIQGTVSQSASWTIDATLVRDRTQQQTIGDERSQNIKEAPRQSKMMRRKIFRVPSVMSPNRLLRLPELTVSPIRFRLPQTPR